MAQKSLRTSLDYTNKFPGSDVVIIIQGQKIHAVSAVLSIASPNFTDLLRRHGKTIDFSDVGAAIDYDAFCELMAIIHPSGGMTLQVNGKAATTMI